MLPYMAYMDPMGMFKQRLVGSSLALCGHMTGPIP
jgi:hypothetical protein